MESKGALRLPSVSSVDKEMNHQPESETSDEESYDNELETAVESRSDLIKPQCSTIKDAERSEAESLNDDAVLETATETSSVDATPIEPVKQLQKSLDEQQLEPVKIERSKERESVRALRLSPKPVVRSMIDRSQGLTLSNVTSVVKGKMNKKESPQEQNVKIEPLQKVATVTRPISKDIIKPEAESSDEDSCDEELETAAESISDPKQHTVATYPGEPNTKDAVDETPIEPVKQQQESIDGKQLEPVKIERSKERESVRALRLSPKPIVQSLITRSQTIKLSNVSSVVKEKLNKKQLHKKEAPLEERVIVEQQIYEDPVVSDTLIPKSTEVLDLEARSSDEESFEELETAAESRSDLLKQQTAGDEAAKSETDSLKGDLEDDIAESGSNSSAVLPVDETPIEPVKRLQQSLDELQLEPVKIERSKERESVRALRLSPKPLVRSLIKEISQQTQDESCHENNEEDSDMLEESIPEQKFKDIEHENESIEQQLETEQATESTSGSHAISVDETPIEQVKNLKKSLDKAIFDKQSLNSPKFQRGKDRESVRALSKMASVSSVLSQTQSVKSNSVQKPGSTGSTPRKKSTKKNLQESETIEDASVSKGLELDKHTGSRSGSSLALSVDDAPEEPALVPSKPIREAKQKQSPNTSMEGSEVKQKTKKQKSPEEVSPCKGLKNLHLSSPPVEAEPGPSNDNIKGEVVSKAEARKVKAGLKRRVRERDSIRALNLPNVRSVVKEMSQEPDSAKRNDDHETGDETSVSTSGTRRKDPIVTMQNIALPRRESLVSIRSGH